VENLWTKRRIPRSSDAWKLSITLVGRRAEVRIRFGRVTGRIGRLRRLRRTSRLAVAFAPAALTLALLSLPAAAQEGGRRPAPRPNILVIMTDDQTVESLRVMASVNQMLASHGTTFVNNFASYPLCCPSRATFLSGQYSHNNGVVGNNYVNGLSRFDQTNTLATWLQGAGYTTGLIGKYLNGYGTRTAKGIPPGWNEWYAAVRLAYFNHTMQRNGKLVSYGTRARDYQTDVYTRTALNFIARRAKGKKPWFLWVSYWAPHYGAPREDGDPPGLKTPARAPRDRGVFAREPVPSPPSFDEADVSDKPAEIRVKPRFSDEQIAAIKADYRQQLESLLAVDDGVRQLVEELKKRGILNRTLIVFTSDNGYLNGEHRVAAGKEVPYEPSIRVPLIMRGPGVPQGRRLEQPVANIDLAPTILDAANGRTRRVFDGRSLLPLLADPGLEWGRDILLERGPGAGYLGARQYTGIHTPRYVYVEYRNAERELYDLARDPDELRSVHNDAAYSAVEAELARRLAALRDCAGAACTAGPVLQLTLSGSTACVRSIRLTGTDERQVGYVDFLVNGRGVLRDDTAPFDLTLSASSGAAGSVALRVVAEMHDGRRLTLDRRLEACG
jgi:N-acetylglucosamine-6-sulfatase